MLVPDMLVTPGSPSDPLSGNFVLAGVGEAPTLEARSTLVCGVVFRHGCFTAGAVAHETAGLRVEISVTHVFPPDI
jgi:hypothetical protein